MNGVLVRDPFPNNKIPVERFSQTAKNYIALARSVLVPNQGAAPGTFGYMNNNYVSEGRSTIETTNKYSLKIDHTLSNTNRVAYVFNRTQQRSRSRAQTGPPAYRRPSAIFRTNTFAASAPRHVGLGGLPHGEPPDGRLKHVQQERVITERRSGLGEQGVHQEFAFDCNQNMGIITFSEFFAVGRGRRTTARSSPLHPQGRRDVHQGLAHDQDRLYVNRQQANGFGQQDYGGRAGFDFKQTGVPGVTNFAAAGGSSFASFLLGYSNSGRTETISFIFPAGVSVLRVLRAGRLAR